MLFRSPGSGEHQQLPHGVIQPLHLTQDLFHDRTALVLAGHVLQQDFDGTAYPGQGIFDLMSNRSCHFPEGCQVFCVQDLVLKPFEFGKIPHDSREYSPLSRTRFPNSKVHGKGCPVFAPARYVTTDADNFSLTGSKVVGEILVMAAVVRFRHEHHDVFANHFIAAVTENPNRSRIKRLHGTFLINGNDAVNDRIQDGTHSLFASAQCLLASLPFTDVQLSQMNRHSRLMGNGLKGLNLIRAEMVRLIGVDGKSSVGATLPHQSHYQHRADSFRDGLVGVLNSRIPAHIENFRDLSAFNDFPESTLGCDDRSLGKVLRSQPVDALEHQFSSFLIQKSDDACLHVQFLCSNPDDFTQERVQFKTGGGEQMADGIESGELLMEGTLRGIFSGLRVHGH